MRRALMGLCVSLMALAHGQALGQTVQPQALTKEEIEKELNSASRFSGTITLNQKPLCSFDSNKAQGLPLGYFNSKEAKPATWAVISATPDVVIKVSSDVPDRVTLTRLGGAAAGKLIVFEKVSSAPATYKIRFLREAGAPDSPGPGDYEFGTTKGTIALFFRCGFTIEAKAQ